MNCKKCGNPLHGKTVCPKCGTSIGYVVTNPSGFDLGSSNNSSNGYVQNNTPNGYVSNNSSMGFGLGISEPSDGAFNKNFVSDTFDSNQIPVENSFENSLPTLGKEKKDNSNIVNINEEDKNDGLFGKFKKKKNNSFINFNESSSTDDISEYGNNSGINFSITGNSMMSCTEDEPQNILSNQMNGDVNSTESNSLQNGMTMNLSDSGKKSIIWVVVAVVILLVIVFGVYILPMFSDIGYSRYEQENFIIMYNKEWTTDVDTNTKKVHFLYKDTGYKVIINSVSTFKEINFKVNTAEDRKTLYKAFYDIWKNVEGGRLSGGSETFYDLKEDGSMYAKIDYVLNDNQGVGSFYVVICEKYDIVISFMTYCMEEDKEVFEEATMKLIEGIDYVGLTALEKEQEEYASFSEGEVKQYNMGDLIDYTIPDSWTFDAERTASLKSEYNIFKFKDNASLLEVRAYARNYTYDDMKKSAISNYGAIKSEKQVTINGKVWYVLVTPDYMSGSVSYHDELYFTMSAGNKYIYYLRTYVANETSNDSVKKAYFDSSVQYILEKMVLHGVEQ